MIIRWAPGCAKVLSLSVCSVCHRRPAGKVTFESIKSHGSTGSTGSKTSSTSTGSEAEFSAAATAAAAAAASSLSAAAKIAAGNPRIVEKGWVFPLAVGLLVTCFKFQV